ncbi:MAG TPA: hypothetical protein VK155_18925 [Bacteroidales bacterium]|nr:hypothetical protein [Bacteroidales bacterium]
MSDPMIRIYDDLIISKRGKKNKVDPGRPYAFLVEKELTAAGKAEDVAVIFLTNTECPFSCLMCDLWKNTTDRPVPEGAIPEQIEYALKNLPGVKHVKLYNSGSFFDRRAVNRKDHARIAAILSSFENVIVECHPKLVTDEILLFRDLLKPSLEIAMGLETVHEGILDKLNKKMSLEDFSRAADLLGKNHVSSRAFILLRPPFMTEEEGIFWAERSVDFAFDSGTGACTIIPVRGGNGIMEELSEKGYFTAPSIKSLEKVLEYGIGLRRGRVFADTWDLDLFSDCDKCLTERVRRITEMNLNQKFLTEVNCKCN